ncbi:aldose 1-epimerase [Flavobacteriaceae bacterium KMM 6897]|nr:aldose 1-epimerase [Flavobacteriaceae bacterium KMM 6897]MEB8344873.1 aldose 1-epimerase [Flavobacteriaceae bacterium KMM 6898]
MEKLTSARSKVHIDAGELVSFKVGRHEFIHQKGNPGWRNSDTEMFPIIGPTNEADFMVETPKGTAVQDQHGLLRELPYTVVSTSATKVVYLKKYISGTEIKNSKFPAKSSAGFLTWPYDFSFEKSYELKGTSLEITFIISGEEGMPFMLGYHPAFYLHSANPIIDTGDKKIGLEEVLAVGNRALAVMDCSAITLNDRKKLSIKTEGFGNFMLWTEVPNMICIEPITFYPYAVTQPRLASGFQFLKKDAKVFKVVISEEN